MQDAIPGVRIGKLDPWTFERYLDSQRKRGIPSIRRSMAPSLRSESRAKGELVIDQVAGAGTRVNGRVERAARVGARWLVR